MKSELEKAVKKAIEAGFQINLKAFKKLQNLPENLNPVVIVEKAIEKLRKKGEEKAFIDENLLEDVIQELTPKQVFTSKVAIKTRAKEIESKISIILDPTKTLNVDCSIEGYVNYFRDRFKRLTQILKRRLDARDAKTTFEVLKAQKGEKIKVIGMISEKIERQERIIMTLEDLHGSIKVLATNRNETALKKAKILVLDQVVCVCGVKIGKDFILAEDFIFPDIPQHKPRKAEEPVYAVLISDLHYGSRMFMCKEFKRFLLWLNGKVGNNILKEISNQVKYLIIAGDLVDGVGVYPGQRRELKIENISEQYAGISKLLAEIPEHIEVIIIPGNHDAVRRALPQPAISGEYGKILTENRDLHLIGNPALIELHGVKFLAFHGRSLDDFALTVPGLGFHNPDKAMILMLKYRHLAPIYGGKTPIAPERKDLLVIEEVPDILLTGHVHVMKTARYRGVIMINSGAWQKQTEYQRKNGLTPTPGIVPVVNLQTLQVLTLDFNVGEIQLASTSQSYI